MIELALFLIFMALIMEIVDSSLGMFYGTLLSPLLIIFGFEPLLVIPAILISQAIGGISGTFFHHRFKNADFNGLTRDTKVAFLMAIPGLIAVVIGALIAVSVPPVILKTYIGVLVIIMSLFCLSKFKFMFKWWKHSIIGAMASFNKVLTGGGFGPLTSTGGIIAGLDPRASIATTTYAEVLICLASFVLYVILYGLSNPLFIILIPNLCIGALIGGMIGPYISNKINQKKLRRFVAVIGIVSGVWILVKIII